MLTDLTRGPFLIDVWHETQADFWDEIRTTWCWRLIGRDGKCHESGSGHASEAYARAAADAVASNEMA